MSPSRTPWAALLVGIPLAAGLLASIRHLPLREIDAQRYVKHPLEKVEVVMFCCAVAAFGTKLWRYGRERRACRWAMNERRPLLPVWNGQPVPVSEASRLLATLEQVPRRLQGTFLVQRVAAVLHFIISRGNATELDDQLRTLSDNDALALEGSYSLTRFITWAIPILGFLGTVLGITEAITGVTPERLEQNLSSVTDGLALAFDATALGLSLTMITMFLSFLVERAEGSILDAVDRYVDHQLAHRFERPAGGPAAETGALSVVEQHTQAVLQTMEQFVQKQAEVWARTLAEVDQRRMEAEARQGQIITAALEAALERTLETHTRRLAALEKQAIEQGSGVVERLAAQAKAVCEAGRDQQAALAKIVQGVAAQAQTVLRFQEGEKQLLRLQETLNQNLAALAGAGAFEQAVHSLTAAIHLLTTRSTALPPGESIRGPRSGAAA
jgi:biopolymer transport protein ExbB/TolQ